MEEVTTLRTKKIKLNIFYSFFIKVLGIATSLLLVRVTLNYLNEEEYGIWLTLSSVLLWINTFDIGLGNGLRNKLAEALANNDFEEARKYISTAYAMISGLMLIIFTVFFTANLFLDWYSILNINRESVKNIADLILMSFGCFCLTFVLKLIGSILLAQQKAALENLLIMLGQFLSLVIILAMKQMVDGDLYWVALAYSIAPAIVYVVSYPFVFSADNRRLIPGFSKIEKSYIKPLMGLGTKFFILQISGLVIFSTSSLLISNMFGPEEVTKYNIAFKYFNVVPLVFSVVLTPIWSATTEAYVRNDINWIRNSMKKIIILLSITFVALAVMVLIADQVYSMWIGKEVDIPMKLSAVIALYIFLIVASLSYSSFLNGIGKLKMQMLNIIVCAIIFIPLNYLLCDYFGIFGIVYSLIIVNLSGLLLNFIQFNLLMKQKARGIWNS